MSAKDCKHEKMYPGTTNEDDGRLPACEKCNKDFTWNEIVILTKAQHDELTKEKQYRAEVQGDLKQAYKQIANLEKYAVLMQDVIEVAKMIDERLFPSHLLREKLDALGGE